MFLFLICQMNPITTRAIWLYIVIFYYRFHNSLMPNFSKKSRSKKPLRLNDDKLI